MKDEEPEIEVDPDDDRLYCDCCGVEVDPEVALVHRCATSARRG